MFLLVYKICIDTVFYWCRKWHGRTNEWKFWKKSKWLCIVFVTFT